MAGDKFNELEDTRKKSTEVIDDDEDGGDDDQDKKGDDDDQGDDAGDKPASYWRSRATRAEQRIEKLKGGHSQPSKQTAEPDVMSDEILDLRFEGFSKTEIQKIAGYAKANGMTIEQAKKDEFVMAGIEKMRSANRSDEATPRPSGRVFVTPTGEKKPFSAMTRDERKHAWESGAVAKAHKGSKNA